MKKYILFAIIMMTICLSACNSSMASESTAKERFPISETTLAYEESFPVESTLTESPSTEPTPTEPTPTEPTPTEPTPTEPTPAETTGVETPPIVKPVSKPEGLSVTPYGYGETEYDQVYYTDETAANNFDITLFGVDYSLKYDESVIRGWIGMRCHIYKNEDGLTVWVNAETGDVIIISKLPYEIPKDLITEKDYRSFAESLLPENIDISGYVASCKTDYVYQVPDYYARRSVNKFYECDGENEHLISYEFKYCKAFAGIPTAEYVQVTLDVQSNTVRFEFFLLGYEESDFSEVLDRMNEIQIYVLYQAHFTSLYYTIDEGKEIFTPNLFMRNGVPCVYSVVKHYLANKDDANDKLEQYTFYISCFK